MNSFQVNIFISLKSTLKSIDMLIKVKKIIMSDKLKCHIEKV